MQFNRLTTLVTNTKAKKNGEEDIVSMPKSIFMSILRAAAFTSPLFDETYYLATHPDVGLAIKSNALKSAAEHFARTGYFENFLPSAIAIDEDYYLSENKDISTAFKKGQITDLQKHFDIQGYGEGRLPYAEYSIWQKI